MGFAREGHSYVRRRLNFPLSCRFTRLVLKIDERSSIGLAASRHGVFKLTIPCCRMACSSSSLRILATWLAPLSPRAARP